MQRAVDLDRPVADPVHLQSLPGVVDRLLQQCHDVGAPTMTGIRRTTDSVVLDHAGALRPLAELRMYSALGVLLDPADPVAGLRRSLDGGVLAALDGADLRFRVGNVPDRWAVAERVVAELGWVNDPHDYDVNLTSAGRDMVAEVGPLFRSRRFPAMARVAASANPLIAALLVQLAKVGDGAVVLDPFCGAATLLIETAAAVPTARLIGVDASAAALTQAAANGALWPGGLLLRADAARLPVAAGPVDRLVTNMPFGKRVGSHTGNVTLYPAFLGEVARVLRVDGRAVLLTEEKTLVRRAIDATRGLRLVREVKLATPGDELHPSAFVVERTRAARRSAGR